MHLRLNLLSIFTLLLAMFFLANCNTSKENEIAECLDNGCDIALIECCEFEQCEDFPVCDNPAEAACEENDCQASPGFPEDECCEFTFCQSSPVCIDGMKICLEEECDSNNAGIDCCMFDICKIFPGCENPVEIACRDNDCQADPKFPEDDCCEFAICQSSIECLDVPGMDDPPSITSATPEEQTIFHNMGQTACPTQGMPIKVVIDGPNPNDIIVTSNESCPFLNLGSMATTNDGVATFNPSFSCSGFKQGLNGCDVEFGCIDQTTGLSCVTNVGVVVNVNVVP